MFDNQPWARLVRRVGKMSWDELRVRTCQEVAKRSDLVLNRIGAQFVKESGDRLPGECGRFFFETADVQSILDLLRRRLPNAVDAIIHQAEAICQHRFDLLGYRGVKYGPRIDWHLDAVHGKRAPLRPWFQIRYLDVDQVGDSKITWELNRHQHLVTLAKAYRLTGRSQFAHEIFEQWYEWRQQNPYPIGINWASSLEVAIRSLSWLWVLHLVQGCSVVPAQFSRDLRRALLLNGRHIERFLSTYFSPNTHLLGEGAGLFFIGTLLQGSALSHRWQRKGWQILLREAQRQVRPDGMHFEHSTYYHTYALDFFLHARVLAALNAMPIPDEFDKTVERMLEVVCRLGNSGPLPRLGDDDGGRVFDPQRNHVEHMLDPLALGALLFSRGDFKAVAGDVREETIWLSGTDAARRFDALHDRRPAPVSFALESSGIHVMSGPEAGERLVVTTGPSVPGRDGHRHADALSLHLTINRHPVLIDPGTFAYVDYSCERNRFRGTPAHNTAHVDHLSQAGPCGPFGWNGLHSAHADRWASGRSFDFFEGSHQGYGRLRDPIEHRRAILYWKPHFWLVRDVVSGAGVHQVGVQWHFADGALTTIPGGVTLFRAQQTALGLLFTSRHPWSNEICRDWHSPVYGSKEPVPLLRCTIEAALPVELVSLLIPFSMTVAYPGVLEPFTTESKGVPVCAYRYSTATAEYLFVFATAPGNWQIGPWSSDARFFATAGVCGELPDRFVVCDASYLLRNGQRVLASKEPLKCAESFSAGGRHHFHCSNPGIVDFVPITGAARNAPPSDVLISA